MRTGEDLRRRCLALPGRDGEGQPLSSPHTTTLIPQTHVYLGGGPPAGGSSVFPVPPTRCSAGFPFPSSPFPPTTGCPPPNPRRRLNPTVCTPRILSHASLQAYLAHPPPPTHLEEVASPPVSSLQDQGGRASCPPASQAPYSSGFHIHPPLDLRPATQQPTLQALASDPGPRAQARPSLSSTSSGPTVLQGVHMPGLQVSRPLSPINTSSSSFSLSLI